MVNLFARANKVFHMQLLKKKEGVFCLITRNLECAQDILNNIPINVQVQLGVLLYQIPVIVGTDSSAFAEAVFNCTAFHRNGVLTVDIDQHYPFDVLVYKDSDRKNPDPSWKGMFGSIHLGELRRDIISYVSSTENIFKKDCLYLSTFPDELERDAIQIYFFLKTGREYTSSCLGRYPLRIDYKIPETGKSSPETPKKPYIHPWSGSGTTLPELKKPNDPILGHAIM